jgi:hypothetical protein
MASLRVIPRHLLTLTQTGIAHAKHWAICLAQARRAWPYTDTEIIAGWSYGHASN